MSIDDSLKKSLKLLQEDIEVMSADLNEIVHNLVTRYSREVDSVISRIRSEIYSTDEVSTITDSTLEKFILELSTNIYFLGEAQEVMNLKEDVSKGVYNEVYNRMRDKAHGTVADKNTSATLASKAEAMTCIIYSRAAKQMKSRTEAAYEVLNSVKKLLTKRIAEYELSNSKYIGRADRGDNNA